MEDRTRLFAQVYDIAMKLNIHRTVVHNVISTYLTYCRDLLLQGEKVDFFGLVAIVPNYRGSSFSRTLAYNCEVVSEICSTPKHTVYSIISTYINDMIESVKKGITVEIRGLVVCKPLYEDGKLTKVYSNISQSLKNILQNKDTKVTSFRVYTCKALRYDMKAGE